MALPFLMCCQSVIPLTVKERELKERLEAIVQEGFEAFMRTAQALSKLRRRRLWRTEAASWEKYVQSRFCLKGSSAEKLLANARLAQTLVDDGVQLRPDTTAAVIGQITGDPR